LNYLGKTFESVVEAVPVVGHVKGAIHYAFGGTERGNQIMKSASRPLGAIAGGIGGFFVGGPVGAVAGGVAMDGIITGIESAVKKEYVPHGIVRSVTNAVQGDDISSGDAFDMVMNIIGDGAVGLAGGGKIVIKAIKPKPNKKTSKASKPKPINKSQPKKHTICKRTPGGPCPPSLPQVMQRNPGGTHAGYRPP